LAIQEVGVGGLLWRNRRTFSLTFRPPAANPLPKAALRRAERRSDSIWHLDNGAVVEQFSATIIAHNLVPPKHDHIFKIRHSWRF
jgi:hypothetical protein